MRKENIFYYETLESTSDKASEALSSGLKAPFAIVASNQTKGRGQRGQSWQSPKGNLYLTLVETPVSKESFESGLLPVKAAYLLASWIRQEFNLKVTLKWPNDLYIGSRKLAGILCETTFRSNAWGELLIGIGLNIKSSPDFEGSYSAVCLDDLFAQNWDVSALANSFISFWQNNWAHLAEETYAAFMLKSKIFRAHAGHVWLNKNEKNKQYYFENVYSQNSNLELVKINQSFSKTSDHLDKINLWSANNSFQWMMQEPKKYPFLIFFKNNHSFTFSYYACLNDQRPKFQINLDSLDESHKLNELFQKGRKEIESQLGIQSVGWPVFMSLLDQKEIKLVERASRANFFNMIEIIHSSIFLAYGSKNISNISIERQAKIESWLYSLKASERSQSSLLGMVINMSLEQISFDYVCSSGEFLKSFIIENNNFKSFHELSKEILTHINNFSNDLGTKYELRYVFSENDLEKILKMKPSSKQKNLLESGLKLLVLGPTFSD